MRRTVAFTLSLWVFGVGVSAQNKDKAGQYLKNEGMKAYAACDDKDLRENPKSYLNKKIRLELEFAEHMDGDVMIRNGERNEFFSNVPGSNTLLSNLMSGRYYHFAQDDKATAVPIVVNKQTKTKLIPVINKFKNRDDIVVYGTLRFFKPKVAFGGDKGLVEYIVEVEDVLRAEEDPIALAAKATGKDKAEDKDKDKDKGDTAKAGNGKKLTIERGPAAE